MSFLHVFNYLLTQFIQKRPLLSTLSEAVLGPGGIKPGATGAALPLLRLTLPGVFFFSRSKFPVIAFFFPIH